MDVPVGPGNDRVAGVVFVPGDTLLIPENARGESAVVDDADGRRPGYVIVQIHEMGIALPVEGQVHLRQAQIARPGAGRARDRPAQPKAAPHLVRAVVNCGFLPAGVAARALDDVRHVGHVSHSAGDGHRRLGSTGPARAGEDGHGGAPTAPRALGGPTEPHGAHTMRNRLTVRLRPDHHHPVSVGADGDIGEAGTEVRRLGEVGRLGWDGVLRGGQRQDDGQHR